MKKALLSKTLLAASVAMVANLSFAGEFKRFSVSAGWLHVMPQGKANPFNVGTAVEKDTRYQVGVISPSAFLDALDPNATLPGTNDNYKESVKNSFPLLASIITDDDGNIKSEYSGTAEFTDDNSGNSLHYWHNDGTGLEADDVDTLGLTFNYYINDNVSLQLIGGIPPKVDIKGKGKIQAPMQGLGNNILAPDVPLKSLIDITDFGNKPKIASVRAWTPALEAQYQFGKTGVNKFRPYVGAGLMFAHFNDIKLNDRTRFDLERAGHMIQYITVDDNAGAALDLAGNPMKQGESSANPYVKVKADDAIAPIVTLGATYDMTENWYGVASVSYAKLNNKVHVDVIDKNTGKRLINASTKVDIDPLITYVGVGYRF